MSTIAISPQAVASQLTQEYASGLPQIDRVARLLRSIPYPLWRADFQTGENHVELRLTASIGNDTDSTVISLIKALRLQEKTFTQEFDGAITMTNPSGSQSIKLTGQPQLLSHLLDRLVPSFFDQTAEAAGFAAGVKAVLDGKRVHEWSEIMREIFLSKEPKEWTVGDPAKVFRDFEMDVHLRPEEADCSFELRDIDAVLFCEDSCASATVIFGRIVQEDEHGNEFPFDEVSVHVRAKEAGYRTHSTELTELGGLQEFLRWQQLRETVITSRR